jgi:hypothetical protein
VGRIEVSIVDHLIAEEVEVLAAIVAEALVVIAAEVRAEDLVEAHLDLTVQADLEEDKFISKIFLFIIYLLINEIWEELLSRH